MPLFEKIRSQTDSALARAFFIIIVLVFVFWGVGANSGQRTQVVAEVNGDSIYYTDVQNIMRRMQRNENMNEAELIQMRTDAIESLIEQRALETFSQDLQLAVSDTEVSLQLLEIEAFKGPDGKFDAEIYDQILSREAFSKTIFEEQQRESLRVRKLQNLLVDSIVVTDKEVEDRLRKTSTTIDVSWIRVPESAVLSFIQVADSDVQSFVASDLTSIEERYNNDKSRLYDLPERVIYESVRIPKASDADATVIENFKAQLLEIRTGVESGQLMKDLAIQKGLSYGNPSLPTAADQLPENTANALFAAESNTVLDVIEIDDALVLYRVIEKVAAEQKSLDDVKNSIALQILQEQRKTEESKKLAQQIRALYEANSSEELQTILSTYNLELQNQTEVRLINPEINDLRDAPELMISLQNVTQAGVLPNVYTTTDGFVVANVVNYTQENNPEMESMLKQFIRSQIQNERTKIAIDSYIKEIVSSADVQRTPLQ